MLSLKTQILMSISHELNNQEEMRSMLGTSRNCIFVQDVGEAVSLLTTRLRPSLVLVTLDYPDDSAFELYAKIKGDIVLEYIPVIFVLPPDAYGREAVCLALGASDVILKPVSQDVLLRRIDKALNEHYMSSYLVTKIYDYQDSLEEEHEKLFAYTKQIVKALSSAIDAKDNYTKGHSKRVADYSYAVGERLGFNVNSLEVLYQAALLHDIGKIGVADAVLRKPGRLSKAELEVIRDHPVIGYQILSAITVIPQIAEGARWHHERYDGTGYPDGLKGDAIPLFARIICVVDAYDAMTSNRSYRKSFTSIQAREEILACSGTQFDPQIADVVVQLIDEKIARDRLVAESDKLLTLFSPLVEIDYYK